MVLRLALRNVFRNTRRSVLTAGGMALALAVLLFTISLQDGAWAQMIDTAVRGNAGHIVVQAQGWQTEQESEQYLTDATALHEAVAAAHPEATVVRRTFLGGLVTSPQGSMAVELRGIQPEAERSLVLLDDKLVEGDWVQGDRDLVIGERLAKTLDVSLGDKVVFMTQIGEGDVNSRLFRVKGIYRTGQEALDAFSALSTWSATQELFPEPDVAHQVAVVYPTSTKGEVDTAKARAAVGERDGVEVLSWREAMPILVEQAELDIKYGNIMYGFMGLIVAVGVLNTVLMSVMERIREFGVLLALGIRPRQLAAMVLLEGGILGVTGGVAGILLALPFVLWITYQGIDYGEMMASAMPVGDVAISTVMKGQLNPPKMLMVAVIAAVGSLLASLWPARHATRLEVVESLRHT